MNPLFDVIGLRCAELAESVLADCWGVQPRAMVRAAARVAQARAVLFPSGAVYPDGITIHLSSTDYQRFAAVRGRLEADLEEGLADLLVRPNQPRARLQVQLAMHATRQRGFTVSSFDLVPPSKNRPNPVRVETSEETTARTSELDDEVATSPAGGARLRLRRGDGSCIEVRGALVLGRAVEGQGRIEDPYASSRHARVEVSEEEARVFDLGSSNHTWVDGCQVESARLEPGSRLRIGRTVLTVGAKPDVKAQAATCGAGVRAGVAGEESAVLERDVETLWSRAVARVPAGTFSSLAWLAEVSGFAFRRLDFARRVRNELAHPDSDRPVAVARVQGAREVLAALVARLDELPDGIA